MKKYLTLLLILAMSSVVSAGTVLVSGLPASVNTSDGPAVLSFDAVSNGQFDNSSLYIYATTGGTLDIAGAANIINPGELYDDDPDNHTFLADYVDTTNVSHPVIWADIAIPHLPEEIFGDIATGFGLTIPQGFVGLIDVSILSETSGIVEGMVSVEAVIPEPITFALLGLGGLFLRRRK